MLLLFEEFGDLLVDEDAVFAESLDVVVGDLLVGEGFLGDLVLGEEVVDDGFFADGVDLIRIGRAGFTWSLMR